MTFEQQVATNTQVVPPAGPSNQRSPGFLSAAEITVWIGAFCFWVLIANPI